MNCDNCKKHGLSCTGGEICLEACETNGMREPFTNADRIRAMSDEELAEYFASAYWDVCNENIPNDPETDECILPSCKQCYLDWLKKEAEK